MSTVFRRSIRSELANTAGAVFTVLFSIVFSVSLVRILGEAAGGRVDDQAVFSIVALSALTSLPTLLTMTLFVSVLMSVLRAHRDSEMVVWFASGLSLLAWIRPVVRFAVPLLVLITALSLLVAPWANQQITASRDEFAKRDDVTRLAPGRFIESPGSDRVIFVETVDLASGRVRNVFVSHRTQNRDGVTVAERGLIETSPDGTRYLVLQNGRRYEGQPGRPEYRVLEFERYAIRLDAQPDTPLSDASTRARSTADLISNFDRFARAEMLSRVSAPVVALLLALLAVPLAHANPRGVRSANLVIAVMLFLLYQNALEITGSMVSRERLPFVTGLWIVHAVVAALVVLLFIRRVRLQRWLPRLRSRARDVAPPGVAMQVPR
jgi:lipopolysaccharide export system permease protein